MRAPLLLCDLNERERAIVLAGGTLARAKQDLALELVATERRGAAPDESRVGGPSR